MKQITLPLGLDAASVDVGTLTLDEGRIYDIEDIDIYRVRNVLGETSYDLKALCLSSLVNKWAAFKPTGNVKPHGMVVLSNEFTYDKPTDADGYDLEHFGGYNHGAPAPMVHSYDITFKWSGETQTKQWQLLALLPEIDIRDIGAGYDRITVDAKATGLDTKTTTLVLTDTEIQNKSAIVEYDFNTKSSSYTLTLEVWLGNSTGLRLVKFPETYSIEVEATVVTVPQILAMMYLDMATGDTYEIELSENTVYDDVEHKAHIWFKLYRTDGVTHEKTQYTSGNYDIDWALSDASQSGTITDAMPGTDFAYCSIQFAASIDKDIALSFKGVAST